jgi:hypothetical protein
VQLATPAGIVSPVFVLKGFRASYSGTDHHVDQLAVSEKNGGLTVALNDQNDDDLFSFEVTYAYLPRAQFRVVSRMVGVVHRVGGGAIETGPAVIRGFNFDFRTSDHHLSEVGVVMPGDGQLTAHFSDKNGDDQFAYTVEYGIIAP